MLPEEQVTIGEISNLKFLKEIPNGNYLYY